ncbi:6-phosphogluconate dehydrogenase [Synechococcus phage S-MbCM6]|uniref:Gnd 6PGDH n=1 Tax=Synechococcus phage S-MbCM6 TaxID=3126011 RepID=H8ZMK1_9CAUD|nr:6-phosphogluconate dehydrogenase [Synechococcus phage ACG-2014c]AFD02712.1 gnd 6PGDH [Synechococcus phage ACG-2014c]
MKVGMIGLGYMGEGMSRLMIKEGIKVWSYSNNYEKSCEQYEAGYVSGVTTSLESLAMIVKTKEIYGEKSGETVQFGESGIFMISVSPEKVDDTLDELVPLLSEGDIIIDYSNGDITKSQEMEKYCSKLGISYIFSGVYGASHAINTCSKIFQSLSPGNATRI